VHELTPILQLLLLISIIITLAKMAGSLSNRLGQPAVLGEMLVGLILGPTFLGMMDLSIFQVHEGPHAIDMEGVLNLLAELGVCLLMFVAGMETDLAGLKKVGKVALAAAIGGAILPMGSGVLIARWYDFQWSEAVFIGTILTATSVSISAQTLIELRQLRSKEGTTILGAAVIDDVLGIIVLSVVVALSVGQQLAGTESAAAESGGGQEVAKQISFIVLRMGFYFIVFWLFGVKYFEKLCQKVSKLPTSQPLLAFVLVTAFLYSLFAEVIGTMASITGAYMAEVLFAQTKFREKIDEAIHPVTYSMFVPIFFINIGLRADCGELFKGESTLITFTLWILVAAIAGKIIGCGVGSKLAGFNMIESTRVGVGMVSRGEVGLIVASVGIVKGIIQPDMFSSMILMVLVTTMVTPLMLRLAFPRVAEVPSEGVEESIAHLQRDKK